MAQKRQLLLCLLVIVISPMYAQYASRTFSKRLEVYTDSLKKVDYKYKLPLLSKKAYKLGFDVPYPIGIGANYFNGQQGIIIENLQLGLKTATKDIPLTPVDFVKFDKNTATVSSFTVRPDVWIFPFLNLYGLFGTGKSTTEVNLSYPVKLKSVVTQNLKMAGVGIVGAFGLGPVFIAMDGNWSWTKLEKLADPVPGNVFGIRLGHNFIFKEKPYRSISLWVGGQRIRIGSGTSGEITLSETLPPEVFQKKDELVNNYNAWYSSLNPNNPADKPKIAIADKVLTPIVERIDAADGSAIVRYAIDKRPTEEWNMIMGSQFQLNKHWQLRTEAGFWGDRTSFLASFNYRMLW